METSFYRYSAIDRMPDIPALTVPNYAELNQLFQEALIAPENHIIRRDPESGHPHFGAYIDSNSNEMVTWGILALGEALRCEDPSWIMPTFEEFFDESLGVYLNSPQHTRIEYWYLFYVNMLAGAIVRTFYSLDFEQRARLGRTADALHMLARQIDYDFNGQGYDFQNQCLFTNRDEYRQPDSIAGYAYNMLFASLHADRPTYRDEAVQALQRYQAFSSNPWYEIPNGSAGLMAAAWLHAHGESVDVEKIAGWVFDHEQGPLQIGKWGSEAIDGLMMGWRGDTREQATSSAYSMETLMPFQFLLPAVRYDPRLAQSVAKFALHALSSFQLFYAQGANKLHETMPELCHAIPYEKLVQVLDGHSPAACGDFYGHRSVYGAGYMLWMEALAVATSDPWIYALDCSITDWLANQTYPVYLLSNPHPEEKRVVFSASLIWKQKCPSLWQEGRWIDVQTGETLDAEDMAVSVLLASKECRILALIPQQAPLHTIGTMLCADEAELIAQP